MNPGSVEFRRYLEISHPPRPGEPKARYLERLGRHYKITPSRMTTLYYDQRKDNARFTTDEYEVIFGHTGTLSETPVSDITLREELEEQARKIEELEKQLAREWEYRRELGKFLLRSPEGQAG